MAPSTPSGMVPVYKKPRAKSRKERPGRPAGHAGARRARPERIDRTKEHTLDRCTKCGTPVEKPVDSRTRITEDIPEERIEPEATEHTIHRYYCTGCREVVEPPVPDALPGSTIGNRLLALTAWLHYGLGNTISQIVAVLNYHLHTRISEGGLVQMWVRLQEVLYAWYERIGEEARASAVLHADETGWRVNGKTHWLWGFTNPTLTDYLIHASRGRKVLLEFFRETFAGVLITDFWGAYNKIVCAARQICFAHLLRALKTVDERNRSADWIAFRKPLKRLLRDALRLAAARETHAPEAFASRRGRLDVRLTELIETSWKDKDAKRLVKRLRRHRNDLFTFVDRPEVSADNNRAEREIRPAVVIRKNSLCNRSDRGAHTQAVLMSIYRTLKLRGHNPIESIVSALEAYLRTGRLPTLPPPVASDG